MKNLEVLLEGYEKNSGESGLRFIFVTQYNHGTTMVQPR